MGKLKKPKQLEAIVYCSKEDNLFIAHSVECDQLGIGDTKGEAIEDLGIALKEVYNLCNKDKTAKFYFAAPEGIQEALQKAKTNPDKYKPIVQEVAGYFKINNYDFTGETVRVD